MQDSPTPVASILSEYIVTPSVLRSVCNQSPGEARKNLLRTLKSTLLHSGIVRNLCRGNWSKYCLDQHLNRMGRELVKKLAKNGRLRELDSSLVETPATDEEWMSEALDSFQKEISMGIICDTVDLQTHSCNDGNVCPLEQLPQAKWWQPCRSSVRPKRNLDDYLQAARFILECGNWIAFIDPHFDPEHPKYSDAINLVCAAGMRYPSPVIEVHRVIYKGSGEHRILIDKSEWEDKFRKKFTDPLAKAQLSLSVYIWDDFHDRYLLSNLAGISLQNGFDTTTQDAKTTWCLMSRGDRDDVQTEFDTNSVKHSLRHKFQIQT